MIECDVKCWCFNPYVTFHAKTYTNGFVFNGLSRWVAVGNPLKVLGKLLCFFHYPLEVLKKAVGNCFPSGWKCWKIAVGIIPLIRWKCSKKCWSKTLDALDQVAVRNLSSEGHCCCHDIMSRCGFKSMQDGFVRSLRQIFSLIAIKTFISSTNYKF